jgi:hypothetical protein
MIAIALTASTQQHCLVGIIICRTITSTSTTSLYSQTEHHLMVNCPIDLKLFQ